MFCNSCGTALDGSIKFCPQCGAALANTISPARSVNRSARTLPSRNSRKIIGGLFLLAAVAALVAGVISKVSSSSDKDRASNSAATSPVAASADGDAAVPQPVAPKPQAPASSGLTLHPYDLMKNPYQSRGQLVALNLNSLPVLYNGAVVQYSGPMDPTMGTRLGLMALRLERMADENVALYNIMGIEAGSSSGQTLGQIAVVLPAGKTELRFDRGWMVQPLEPLKGTNYLGAAIQIPSVRFWRYAGEKDESTENQAASLAPGRGFRYTKYPNGYMVDELCSTRERGFCYSFNWQPWMKELELKTAGQQADALIADTGSGGPGNLVISWDSEQRVVFGGFRPHASTDASAYVIVAPSKREMDIVWQRGDDVTYLGPNATLLKSAHVYEWLKQVGP